MLWPKKLTGRPEADGAGVGAGAGAGAGGGGAMTVTDVDANFVGSALLVAVTVSVPAVVGAL
jgi:hypothetical protein